MITEYIFGLACGKNKSDSEHPRPADFGSFWIRLSDPNLYNKSWTKNKKHTRKNTGRTQWWNARLVFSQKAKIHAT